MSTPHDPPPELAPPPANKLQFNIKHLLACMLATAFLATAVRYALPWFERLPTQHLPGYVTTALWAVAIGGLLYFIVRAPFWGRSAVRFKTRWRALHQHRRELHAWAKTRQQAKARIMEEKTESSLASDTDHAPSA
ncbi:MAG: hypothetical protein WD872_12175 [Pirellulaceae bacterium]